jgi:hypothetical protein
MSRIHFAAVRSPSRTRVWWTRMRLRTKNNPGDRRDAFYRGEPVRGIHRTPQLVGAEKTWYGMLSVDINHSWRDGGLR